MKIINKEIKEILRKDFREIFVKEFVDILIELPFSNLVDYIDNLQEMIRTHYESKIKELEFTLKSPIKQLEITYKINI